jgi:hypothetical protein
MDKRKLIRNLIIGTIATAVVVGGYVVYKKQKRSKQISDLEKQGYKCGECTDAKVIICENNQGDKRKVSCSLLPNVY